MATIFHVKEETLTPFTLAAGDNTSSGVHGMLMLAYEIEMNTNSGEK